MKTVGFQGTENPNGFSRELSVPIVAPLRNLENFDFHCTVDFDKLLRKSKSASINTPKILNTAKYYLGVCCL